MPITFRVIFLLFGLISVVKPKYVLILCDVYMIKYDVEYSKFMLVSTRILGLLFIIMTFFSDLFFTLEFHLFYYPESLLFSLIFIILFIDGIISLIKTKWILRLTTFIRFNEEPDYTIYYIFSIKFKGLTEIGIGSFMIFSMVN